MDTQTMIKEVNAVVEKHKNDFVSTCQTNITAMCRDILPKLEKLKEYEDLEERGKLLKLPCAVGDTVYEICEGFIEPCTVQVIFLADYTDEDGNQSYMMEIHYDREDCHWVSTEVYFTDIGKTVFFTREQAETELKKNEEVQEQHKNG